MNAEIDERMRRWRTRPKRTVVFDAVGTVIYANPAVDEIYQQVGRRYGSSASRETVKERFREAFRERYGNAADVDLTTSETIERDRWGEIVSHVLADADDPHQCFSDLFEHFGRPHAWRCFGDVAATMELLAEHDVRVAIASNFDDRLNTICDSLPPLQSISVRVISSLVGFRKPSRHFFERLVDTLECDAVDVVMVGDDPINDVKGAESAGIHGELVRRTGYPDEDVSLLKLVQRVIGTAG